MLNQIHNHSDSTSIQKQARSEAKADICGSEPSCCYLLIIISCNTDAAFTLHVKNCCNVQNRPCDAMQFIYTLLFILLPVLNILHTPVY